MRKNSGEKDGLRFRRGTSIRDRLAGLYLVVTASLMVMVFVLVYVLVEHEVYRHIDEELDEEVGEFVGSLRVTENGLLFEDQTEWMERSHITVDFYPKFVQVVVAGASPEIMKKSFNLFSDTLCYNPVLEKAAFYNSAIGGAAVRQVQVPVFQGDGSGVAAWVLVAVPLEESLFVLHDLRIALFFSLAVVLLTLFFVTRFLAGKSIDPIEQVIETAETITRENLDERIVLPSRKDELYRLSFTINSLLDRLQDAYVREKQFTSDASHELKTPLTSVMGTLEVLIRKPRDPGYYEARIGFCINELKRMSGLIEQLLLLARYDAGSFRPDIEVVDAEQIVEKVLARAEDLVRQQQLQVSIRSKKEVLVRADASMLGVMLDNIVSNAVKYSRKGGHIDVELERRGGSVFCSVTDSGTGIPPEKIERLFERFYRVDESRNSQISGTGLGLALVKKLADMQHITVGLSSVEHVGTVVTFEIPAA